MVKGARARVDGIIVARVGDDVVALIAAVVGAALAWSGVMSRLRHNFNKHDPTAPPACEEYECGGPHW